MLRLVVLALTVLLAACGDSDTGDDHDKSAPALPVGVVEMRLWNKTIRIEDEPFALNCNAFSGEYMVSAKHECTGMTVDVALVEDAAGGYTNQWTLKTIGNVTEYSALELDGERLRIDGKDYNCLVYTGDFFSKQGDDVGYAYWTIYSTKAATKPSEIDRNAVLFVGVSDPEFCDARTLD